MVSRDSLLQEKADQRRDGERASTALGSLAVGLIVVARSIVQYFMSRSVLWYTGVTQYSTLSADHHQCGVMLGKSKNIKIA